MQQLQQQLDGHVSVFVGQSGVGKSSLVNSLLPEVDTRVGPLSELTGKGTHTTTTARLFHFPRGGELIDSPGAEHAAPPVQDGQGDELAFLYPGDPG